MKKEECLAVFERYMQNTASDEEIKSLSKWIRSSKEISGWLEQQILSSSADIDKVVQMRLFENIKVGILANSQRVSTPVKVNKIQIQTRKWMRIAAIFILPIFTAAGMYFYMLKTGVSNTPFVISVERGQRACVALPDGSKAWLNSESKLTYSAEYNKFDRELHLEGEAYFEVAHNPEKPFIVKSKDMAVEALGTVFEVKAYPDDNLISSVLMKGKVRVTTAGGVVILTPNQRILYNKKTNQLDKQNVVRSGDFAGWINNELRFEDESLQEIAKCIQRIYDVQIEFADENSKNYHFTGTVPNDSLEGVLNIISITSPIFINMNKNQINIRKKN